MRASFAYGISFFSIVLLLSVWLIFPFFSFFWLFLLIAIATTPTAYVYVMGSDEDTGMKGNTDQLKRKDLEAVALAF